MASSIELDLTAPTATLWLNRPHRGNAINGEMVHAITTAIEELERRDDIRVLFIRGRGRKFCAGADLKELAEHAQNPAAELALANTLERLAALPLIVVAVIERYAVGGGFLMTLYCDLRVAAAGSTLGVTPLARQWMVPWGLSRLAMWLGPARAQQLLLVKGTVDAEHALTLGLVDRIADPAHLDMICAQLANELAVCPREVIRDVKTFFSQWKGTPHARWDRISAAAFRRTFQNESARQAVADFINGKPTNHEEQPEARR